MDKLTLSNWLMLVTAAGVIIAIISNVSAMRDRGKMEATTTAEMRSDIKYIKESLKKLETRYEDLPERVKVVEESTKQAHKRIDRWEKGEVK